MNPARPLDVRLALLRTVLAVAAAGHAITGLSFWFVPHLAIDEVLAWGEPSGWTAILGAYDLAVAYALWLAFRDPAGNPGLLRFAAVLLALHAGTHAYFNIWGGAPSRLWIPTAILALGSVLVVALAPRVRRVVVPAPSGASQRTRLGA
jgi:hypothetical protein